ncbi:hypothetical protein VTN00DRAFT_185 [Thermoascus crustaceus]|uniref:uncharacterized protein n=1 Tax=Thermoascus crustaceus TaxID=5088 RepID=UPI0037435F7B
MTSSEPSGLVLFRGLSVFPRRPAGILDTGDRLPYHTHTKRPPRSRPHRPRPLGSGGVGPSRPHSPILSRASGKPSSAHPAWGTPSEDGAAVFPCHPPMQPTGISHLLHPRRRTDTALANQRRPSSLSPDT